MSTLCEIEAAADALSPAEKQELLLFLAAKLRGSNAAPLQTCPCIYRGRNPQLDLPG